MTKNTSENAKELPNGWELKKLANVCEKITDGTHQTPTYFDEGVIFLSSKNVTSGKIDWDNVKYIDNKQHIEMHKRVAPRLNDILLAKNGTTGVAAMVDRDVVFDIYVSLAFLRPLNIILPNYLLHYINSPQAKNQFNGRLKGAGVPNLHLEEIREVEIPLPPLKEQERIVQKLDTAFQSLDEAITLQKENIAHTQELKKAVLVEQISNLSCEMKKLGEITDNLDGKRKPVKSSDRQNLQGQYPYYGASGIIDYVNEYIFDGEFLLISEDGANLVVRKTPIAFVATGKFWVNNHAHIVNAKAKVTTNRFLEYALSNTDISNFITGSAQPKLSQGKLNEIQIPIPPLPEQEKIVAYLDTIFAKLDTLMVEQQERLTQLMELKKSILQEAFEGKL